MKYRDIIIRPVISEKSMRETEHDKFTFIVAKEATKVAIKQAVQKLFGVHVVSVATTIVKGKTRRMGTRRVETNRPSFKKAMVGLMKGEKIAMFDIGEKK